MNKFVIGGLMILAAVVYLIFSSVAAGAEYFFTIDELVSRGDEAIGMPSRVTGAVIGDSIHYDLETLTLTFEIAHMPADKDLLSGEGGLAVALHQAVTDPTRTRMTVVYVGPRPDLLQDEAQAILTGKLGEDGIFYADELLLKCPTRYEEAAPEQTGN